MVSVHISLPQNQVPVQTIQQKISYEKGVKQLTDMVSSVQSSSVIFIMELRLAYAFCTCVLFNILMLCQIRHVQCLGVPSTTRSTYSTLDGKICYKCRPGQHLVENCTNSGEDAKCRSCPSGTFQSGENIAQNCTKCTLSCNNAHKKTNSECNGTTDLICQCVPGYFTGENNTCKQHSTCPPGQGVKEKGNVNTDTVCEPCTEGKFSSNDSATETCKPCTRCKEQGYTVTAPCMPERDTTCGSRQSEDQRSSEGMPNQSGRNSFNDHNNENVSDPDTTNQPSLTHSESVAIGGGDSSSGLVVNSVETGPSVSQNERDIYFSEGIANHVLQKLSKDLISRDWKFFFRCLSAKENEIDQVVIDHHTVHEQIYQLLHCLNQRGMLKMTNITETLKKMGRNDLAAELNLPER